MAGPKTSNRKLEFVVTIEHLLSGERVEFVVDDDFKLKSWPSSLDRDRLQALADGFDDSRGEYKYLHRRLG
jgi:hypothetical protein